MCYCIGFMIEQNKSIFIFLGIDKKKLNFSTNHHTEYHYHMMRQIMIKPTRKYPNM